jgi:hypothetical protein
MNNFFSRLRKKMAGLVQGSYGEHDLIHPALVWALGLMAALVLMVAGGAWALMTYRYYQNPSQFEDASSEITTIYRAPLVAESLRRLESRNQVFVDLQRSRTTPIPPAGELPVETSTSTSTATGTLPVSPLPVLANPDQGEDLPTETEATPEVSAERQIFTPAP